MEINKLKIIKVIHSTYKYKAYEFFRQKKNLVLSKEGKWKELIYCILAGTQVPVETAKKAQLSILEYKDEHGVIWDIKRLAKKSEQDIQKLEYILRNSGYRYPKIKAKCIINGAEFFIKNYGSIDKFLNSQSDIKLLREKMIKKIKGIGIKIATHWLRNIGYPFGTIDIHVRRLLKWTGLIELEKWTNTMTDKTFMVLEEKIKNLAEKMGLEINVFQYELWLYGRNFCSKNKCKECKANNFCLKGKDMLSKSKV